LRAGLSRMAGSPFLSSWPGLSRPPICGRPPARKDFESTVYITTNRPNGSLYVGVTRDFMRRALEHRMGLVEGLTKRYGLKRLVYFERPQEIGWPIRRERAMKPRSRAWTVKLILAANPY
jgi:putative endonuclease